MFHELNQIIPMEPSLVLVQPRKTRPFITERLLMGRKESNQTNKNSNGLVYRVQTGFTARFYSMNITT